MHRGCYSEQDGLDKKEEYYFVQVLPLGKGCTLEAIMGNWSMSDWSWLILGYICVAAAFLYGVHLYDKRWHRKHPEVCDVDYSNIDILLRQQGH